MLFFLEVINKYSERNYATTLLDFFIPVECRESGDSDVVTLFRVARGSTRAGSRFRLGGCGPERM